MIELEKERKIAVEYLVQLYKQVEDFSQLILDCRTQIESASTTEELMQAENAFYDELESDKFQILRDTIF